MKGTIIDFLNQISRNPALAKEFAELAAKHGFEFTDEVSDEELESVAGGAIGEVQAMADQVDQAREDAASNLYSAVTNAVLSATNSVKRVYDPTIKPL